MFGKKTDYKANKRDYQFKEDMTLKINDIINNSVPEDNEELKETLRSLRDKINDPNRSLSDVDKKSLEQIEKAISESISNIALDISLDGGALADTYVEYILTCIAERKAIAFKPAPQSNEEKSLRSILKKLLTLDKSSFTAEYSRERLEKEISTSIVLIKRQYINSPKAKSLYIDVELEKLYSAVVSCIGVDISRAAAALKNAATEGRSKVVQFKSRGDRITAGAKIVENAIAGARLQTELIKDDVTVEQARKSQLEMQFARNMDNTIEANRLDEEINISDRALGDLAVSMELNTARLSHLRKITSLIERFKRKGFSGKTEAELENLLNPSVLAEKLENDKKLSLLTEELERLLGPDEIKRLGGGTEAKLSDSAAARREALLKKHAENQKFGIEDAAKTPNKNDPEDK